MHLRTCTREIERSCTALNPSPIFNNNSRVKRAAPQDGGGRQEGSDRSRVSEERATGGFGSLVEDETSESSPGPGAPLSSRRYSTSTIIVFLMSEVPLYSTSTITVETLRAAGRGAWALSVLLYSRYRS